jgi:hypothetical protein
VKGGKAGCYSRAGVISAAVIIIHVLNEIIYQIPEPQLAAHYRV